MTACICRACGRPAWDAPVAELAGALTPTEGRILEIVARRPGIARPDVAGLLYANRADGGPDFALTVVSVSVHRINRKLAGRGWRVHGTPGVGGGYVVRPA